MRLATFEGDRDISSLVHRLLHLGGPKAPELRKTAEEELLRANPALAHMDRLVPGTVIVIPDEVPGEMRPDETIADRGLEEILDEVVRALEDLRTADARAAEQEVAVAKESLLTLEDAELKRAVRRSPNLKEIVGQAASTADDQAELAAAKRAHQDEALAEITRDIQEFARELRGR